MSFINPLLLIGILAAGIPLLIHLWSKRQARLVDFSYVQFLMSLHRKRIRRLKLKQILILIIRMLIITLIVIALARPVIRSKWALAAGGQAKSSVVILLDNSYSMSYEGVNGNRFEIAKDKALSLLGSLRPGDNASLILVSDHPGVVFKQLTSNIQQVENSIKDARISHRGSYVWPSIREACAILKDSDHPRKVIYLISDLGKNGWQNWEKIPEETDTVDVFVIKISDEEAENRAIESVSLSSEPVGIGTPVQIIAKFSTSGSKSDEVTVEMFLDGEKKGQSVTKIGTPVTFNHTYEYPGIHVGEIRLTTDRLSLDDVRYFAVDVLGQIKVLSTGEYRHYVNLALNPVTSLNPEAEYLILPVSCEVEELGRLSLDQYNVVLLVDVIQISTEGVRNLEKYALNGGNIIVFLGEDADKDWYNNKFDPLPAELGNRISSPQLRLSVLDEKHPIFSVFFESDNGKRAADALSSIEFYSAFSLKPKPSASIIARFDKDIPAIMEAEVGKGRILLFNSSPDTKVSDLPLNPGFLPIMQQMVLYLVSAGTTQSNRNIVVGDTYTQFIRDKIDSQPSLFDPEGSNFTPAVSNADGGSQIQYGPAERAGIYRLEYKSAGNLHRSYFAVNPNTSGESELKAAKDSEVIDKLGDRARFLSPDESPGEIVTSVRGGGEFSSRLLIIAGILMLMEIPLANRRKI